VVEQVTMVDIDEELVKICAELLPEWCGKLDDPRLTIRYQDAGEFLSGGNNQYDLIVWDLVDPHRWDNSGLTAASNLYKPDFFDSLKKHLDENGLLSLEYANRNKKLMSDLLRDWRKISQKRMYIPSFDEGWVFALMDKNH
jgi:spermidine synthase